MPSLERAFGAAGALCGGLVLSALLRGAARTAQLATTHGARLGLEMAGFAAAFAGLAVAGALLLPGGAAERLGWRPGRFRTGRLVLVAIGTFALSHAVHALLVLLEVVQRSALADIEGHLAGTRGLGLALALLGMAVAPALGEELLCRGLFQRSLVPWLGAPAAIGLSALFFGALHVDLVHASAATVLGLYLGTLAHWADSIRPAVFAHAANNVLAVLGSSGILAGSPPPGVSLPVGLAIALACLIGARPRSHGPPGDPLPSQVAGTPLQPVDRPVDD